MLERKQTPSHATNVQPVFGKSAHRVSLWRLHAQRRVGKPDQADENEAAFRLLLLRHVARHQVTRRNKLDASIAPCRNARRGQFLESSHRFGAVFLDKAPCSASCARDEVKGLSLSGLKASAGTRKRPWEGTENDGRVIRIVIVSSIKSS